MKWIIDEKINLTELVETSEWHYATTVQALRDMDIEQREAEGFTAFIFAEVAQIDDCNPMDHLTDEMWSRLTVQ